MSRKPLGLTPAVVVLYLFLVAFGGAGFWLLDGNVADIRDLSNRVDQKADKAAVAAQEARARNAAKIRRNTAAVKRNRTRIVRLNRIVLGTPGKPGIAGQSIRGPRGVTGLTTIGERGAFGPPGADSTVPGPPGRDGADAADGADGDDSTVPGPEGPPGPQGPGPTDDQVRAAVMVVLAGATFTCEPTVDVLDPPTTYTCTLDP